MEAIFTKLFLGVHLMAIYTSGSCYTTNVQIDQTGLSWFNASLRCGENGLENDLSVLSRSEELQNEEFWIGLIQYKEITPWIEPVGCYRISNKETNTTKKQSVGSCQHYCKSTLYFGYQESSCQCFSHNKFLNLIRVNTSKCLFPHTSSKEIIMVYAVFHLPRSDDRNKKCLSSICKDKHVTLEPVHCSEHSNDRVAICDDLQRTQSDKRRWNVDYATAKDFCLKENKTLLSSRNCTVPPGIFAWTSAFREDVVVEYQMEKINTTTAAVCLSGLKSTTESQGVHIEHRNCNEPLNLFVCRSNCYFDTTSVRSVYKIATTFKGLDLEPTTDSLIANDHDNTFARNTGVIVGGIIGGTVFLVVVTLLIVLIQRKRNNQASTSRGVHSSANKREVSTKKDVSTMHYNVTEKNIARVDDYAVVKKENKLLNRSMPEYAAVQKGHNNATPDDTYAVAPEDEYDKLNNILLRTNSHKPNIYGITGKCAEDEYDTMKDVSLSNINRTNNLYDTNTFMSSKYGDTTYDSSSVMQNR